MRKTTMAVVAIAGIAAPFAAVQASNAGLVHQTVSAAAAMWSTPSASPSVATKLATPSASPTADPSEASTPKALLAAGDRNEQVRAIQTRLAAAGRFTREATGYYGEVTVQAVRKFQHTQGLPATGSVDQATLDAIMALTAPAAEPTASTTDSATATSSAAASVSATIGTTSSGKPRGTATRPVAKLDERCLTGHVLCVDKTRQRLYWVVDGTIVDSFSTRTGRPGLATREGEFRVFQMEEKSWSNLYHVWMPYAMYFSGGQAVHYSSDFANNGYGEGSHGCVNLRDHSGIAWLYSQVKIGDKVVVYRS